MHFFRLSVAAAFVAMSLFASLSRAGTPLSVYTVNYPLAYFAQRIGGPEVQVTFPAPRDVDPSFWNPDALTIQRYQQANIVLLNGAGYERWIARASLPRKTAVVTSAAFRDRYIHLKDQVSHSHGPSGQHSHNGTAFVTWLDLAQATEQAKAIKDAFVRFRPVAGALFETNYAVLAGELTALDAELQEAFASVKRQPLLASHPIFQYLERRYQLDLTSVTWEPDQAPSAGEWRHLEMQLKARPARWMLWEDEPRRETVLRLKELGVGVIVFNPSQNVAKAGDFLGVMRQNVTNVKMAVAR